MWLGADVREPVHLAERAEDLRDGAGGAEGADLQQDRAVVPAGVEGHLRELLRAEDLREGEREAEAEAVRAAEAEPAGAEQEQLRVQGGAEDPGVYLVRSVCDYGLETRKSSRISS